MPLETAAHISGLVASNPASSDGLNQADDHMRLIKQVLLTDVGGALTNQLLTLPDGSGSAPAVGYAADATAGFWRRKTGQQVVVGNLIGTGTVDIGFIAMYAGATAPTGYLACDGQAVSRTTYSDLYQAIGTTWGAGDGSTTFNVPNLLDRFPRHRNTNTGNLAGAVGTIQAAQTAPHTHTGSGSTGTESANHTHTFSGTTGNDSPDHTHTSNINAGGASGGVTGGGALSLNVSPSTVTSGGASTRHTHSFSGTTSIESGGHQHNFSFTTSNGSTDGTETRPLSATVLFCIRAL